MSLGQLSRSAPVSKTAAHDYEKGTRILPESLVGPYSELFSDLPREQLAEYRLAALAEEEKERLAGLAAKPSPRRWRLGAVSGIAVAGLAAVIAILTAHHSSAGGVKGVTETETTGGSARTWSDPQIAGGRAGQPLAGQESVQVSCRKRGFIVPDRNPWWYRLASPPWNNKFYATTDAFYNQGSTSGPLDNGVIVDESVRLC